MQKKGKKINTINQLTTGTPAQTLQESIPIYAVHEEFNLIETYPGCYTKSYAIGEINYQMATEEEQDILFDIWKGVFKSLGANVEFAQSIFNRNINMEQFCEETLKKEVGDKLDYLRRELNQITLGWITEGKNGIKKDKIITLALHETSVKKASETFKRLDRELDKNLKKMSSFATPLKLEDRLEFLYDICNIGSEGEFLTKTKIMNEETGKIEEVSSFDFETIRSMGLTVNDIIAPSSLVFKKDRIESGSKHLRILQITDYPNTITDEFLSDLTNQTFNMLVTQNVKPISKPQATNLVSKNIMLIREEKNKQRQRALRNNQSEDMISPEILDRETEAFELRTAMREADEDLYETVLTICIFANTLSELQDYTDTIVTACKSVSVSVEVLEEMQEEGFKTTLPLCCNVIPVKNRRTLKTTSVAAFMPFSILELNDKNGINYSLNAVSKNLILYDRLGTQNYNGFILGTPGCFAGDTQIALSDGTIHTLKELAESEKFRFEVNGYNPEKKAIESQTIIHARKVKEVSQLAKVTLSNGTVLRCTPDHLFMLKDGTYIPAEKLQKGSALMPKHTVKNVSIIQYKEKVPVYDLEAENQWENYQLACGIIVHNSGKSFTAKIEMLNVLLGSNSDIIVIDPESEYGALARLTGGEVIKITPGGKHCISPMDITVDYEIEDETDPVFAKADFILKLCEAIIKTPFGLNSIQEAIIDECVHKLYSPFYVDGKLRPIPPEKMPTLSDLQQELARRSEPEARELQMALRLYTGKGSLNTFSQRTNVDANNRFIVYDISEIGDKMKPMAMLVILDSIWNKIAQNRKIGKNTWFYVDEIYLLFQNELSATFLNILFKRARKYGGVPTGITQNVEDLLESDTARKMLSNCNFVQMLNQAPNDRMKLQQLLNLSDYQMDYITSAPKGQGLIYTGTNTVPFYSQFPKDNSIYRCLTSDMKEIKAYEEAERRAALKQKKILAKNQLNAVG